MDGWRINDSHEVLASSRWRKPVDAPVILPEDYRVQSIVNAIYCVVVTLVAISDEL
jgi:hypothetical protein